MVLLSVKSSWLLDLSVKGKQCYKVPKPTFPHWRDSQTRFSTGFGVIWSFFSFHFYEKVKMKLSAHSGHLFSNLLRNQSPVVPRQNKSNEAYSKRSVAKRGLQKIYSIHLAKMFQNHCLKGNNQICSGFRRGFNLVPAKTSLNLTAWQGDHPFQVTQLGK